MQYLICTKEYISINNIIYINFCNITKLKVLRASGELCSKDPT